MNTHSPIWRLLPLTFIATLGACSNHPPVPAFPENSPANSHARQAPIPADTGTLNSRTVAAPDMPEMDHSMHH